MNHILLLLVNVVLSQDTFLDYTFTIRASESQSNCLDINAGSDKGNAQLYRCHYGDNQQFRIADLDNDGYYRLISVHNGLCLDAVRGGAPPWNIHSYPCLERDNQKWRVDGSSSLRNKYYSDSVKSGAGECLYFAKSGDDKNNAQIGGCNQKIKIVQVLLIESTDIDNNNYCLKVNENAKFNNDDYKIYADNCPAGDSLDSHYLFRKDDLDNDNYFRLRSEFDNKCIDVSPSSTGNNNNINNGDKVYSNSCSSGNNQKWIINNNGKIQSKRDDDNKDWCLTISSGKEIIVYECNGNEPNTWEISGIY